jgi:hypothetical protein
MDIRLPAEAQDAVETYLGALGEALPPERCQGVYLTGSSVLGDWQPGRSDLDILTVTDAPLTAAERGALAEVHGTLDGTPYCDAVYVTADVLGLASETSFPYTVDGEFHPDGYVVDPVLWATLHRHGVALRGPAADSVGAEPDAGWLRDWNLGNLRSYWLAGALDGRRRVAECDPAAPAAAYVAVWNLTGPGRLHCTVATGEIISKTAAVDYTAGRFAGYGDLLGRAKAWRLGDESVSFTHAEVARIFDLVEAIVEDATWMAAHRPSGCR